MLALGALLVAPGPDRRQAAPAPSAPQAHAPGPPVPAATDLDLDDETPPIMLPPPYGSVPRIRPLQTAWIISPHVAADPATASVVTEETAVVIDYIAQHGLAQDRLAIEPGPPHIVVEATDALHDAAAIPAVHFGAPTTVAAQVIATLGARPDDDQSVVFIAASTGGWPEALPPNINRTPLTPLGQTSTASHVLELLPGAGPNSALRASTPLPQHVLVDTSVRGELATALARLWVESYGGKWSAP